jgi:hypothetical protein
VINVLNRKESQLSEHKKRLIRYESDMKRMGQEKQDKIFQTLAQAQENEKNLKSRVETKLSYKFTKAQNLK